MEIPNLMPDGESSPLLGDGWQFATPDVFFLVLLSTRREIVVSDNTRVKLFSPTLSPHLVGGLSQIVGG
jgi:hypothetical protein